MIIIDPIDIMPAMVVSNTAVDESLPSWEAGTYTQGDEVIYERKIYEALASPTTDRPDLGVLKTPATWLDVGAVNSWRMFDERIETQSTAETALVVSIQTGSAVTAVSAFNVTAVSMTVRMTDPAVTADPVCMLTTSDCTASSALRAIAKHTRQSAQNTEILDRWDFDGLPQERTA